MPIDLEELEAIRGGLESMGDTKVTFYKGIPGRFDYHDLYRQAVERAQDGDHFVEVGSLFGASVAFLADTAAAAGKRIEIDAVDLWDPKWPLGQQPIFQSLSSDAGGFFEAFCFFLKQHGAADRVNVMRGDSLQKLQQYPDKSLQFVFLDGHHGYEHVAHEIEIVREKIKPGGVLSGHDYYPEFPALYPEVNGVAQAAREAFGSKLKILSGDWVQSWWVEL